MAICNGHFPTETGVRSGSAVVVAAMRYIVVGKRQRVSSDVRVFTWFYPSFFYSKVVIVINGSKMDLGH